MAEQEVHTDRFPRMTGRDEQPYTIDISDADLRTALNLIVRDSLRPAALGISLIYVVMAPSYFIRFSSSVALPLAVLAVVTTVTLLVLYLVLGRWRLPLRWAHPVTAGMAALVLTNTVAQHIYARPHYYSNYSLLIVGVGFLILNIRWLAAILAVACGGWALTVAVAHPDSSTTEFSLQIVGAVVLSFIVHAVRMRMLCRLERLRLQDAQRETVLAEAVLKARQNEERFRKLSNATFEGILIHDQGRVLDANQALLDMFGYRFEETVNKSMLQFLTPGTRGQVQAAMQAEIEMPYEATGVHRDGSEFPIEICAKTIVHEGRVVRVAAVRDITERKRTEAEREQLIRELDEFARTVAHDLKNPLNLVMAYVHLLLEDAGVMCPGEVRSYLKEIASGGFKMNSIIDALLLLAQMRQAAVQFEPLDLTVIVVEAWDRLALLREEHNAELILPDEWPPVSGYAPWVEGVWANYLSNAIKYGDSPRIEVGAAAQADGMVRCWVRDYGTGLTPEQQGQLFTPFTRLEHQRSEGHGLGLWIVQRIVDRLGGQVGVERAAGGGSRFWFTLPGCERSSDECFNDVCEDQPYTSS